MLIFIVGILAKIWTKYESIFCLNNVANWIDFCENSSNLNYFEQTILFQENILMVNKFELRIKMNYWKKFRRPIKTKHYQSFIEKNVNLFIIKTKQQKNYMFLKTIVYTIKTNNL